jgi:hypothetical protein
MLSRTAIALVAVFFTMAAVSPVFAVENKRSLKKDSVTAARAVVDYPANLVNESVNVVGGAVKGTAGTVVNTVKATGETVTGQPDKAKEIVTAPVMGVAGTVKDAAEGTVTAPVKAGEDTAEQLQ